VLSEIIGQENIKESLAIIVESVKKLGGPCPNMLFHSAGGLGKTMFARAVSGELGYDFHEINVASKGSDKISFLIMLEELKTNSIVFLDEIHGLDKKLQEILYSAIDSGYVSAGDLFGSSSKVNAFTLIGATTNLHKLNQPLISRFKYSFELQEYSNQELAKILEGECKKINFQFDPILLSSYARGNPRQAKNYLDWIFRYCTTKRVTPTEGVVREAMKQKGVYQLGLTTNDIRYLKLLAEKRILGVRQISNTLNIEEKTVKANIEPYLLSQDLIAINNNMGGKRCANTEKIKELGIF
jgi:Holliday junction DNA helicase RuvB